MSRYINFPDGIMEENDILREIIRKNFIVLDNFIYSKDITYNYRHKYYKVLREIMEKKK
jgi:hypothetical protein